MREYPNEHNKIVSELLDGKFIISPSSLFYKIQELEDDYSEFFKKSFNYNLNIEAEFAYLSSNEVTEKRTRDFTLFLAILSRELDYSGKNFRDKIELGSFDIYETEELLRQSSKWEILEKTTVSEFEKFLKTWRGKNLIVLDGNKFKFTKAVKLFFTYAMEIAEEKLKNKDNE